ncbi:type I addiction module toxin, SymE family [Elizabethkingia meningoseptica]|uniref:Toxin SymE-like domain-containing protein n=1 Tax=Elizabethkingia meningoseptica TaxID=238 RepID=A0A1T3JJS7_ELIME|nr:MULTISPECIES: type I addiction module toxin, SymE family [Elizabethkingia]AQX06510.1 hypothetical protein BBD33_15135 [Elizabethkingia meningoseptica]AQX14043.1 hypothetical protein BBD35_17440 [Elizabethkingia meningoseptica]AQX48557.1 hypothetical protein B5G46_15130 [Elizabethkingia meningoseptica]EJK5327961.1 type I addiction module toxin, SymE family [Elizabethkingia meningoseptica]EOR28310.1 hypothetical protein L100_17025 [Elizabethkingia meningoseptica ATCC 13253 = NBRC 12535]
MCTLKLLDEKEVLLETRRLIVCRTKLSAYDYYSKINIMGKWVRKCGFEPGERLSVKVYKNRIIIEKEEPYTIDPALLERMQRASEEELKRRLKRLVGADIFEQLCFPDGRIKIK